MSVPRLIACLPAVDACVSQKALHDNPSVRVKDLKQVSLGSVSRVQKADGPKGEIGAAQLQRAQPFGVGRVDLQAVAEEDDKVRGRNTDGICGGRRGGRVFLSS